MRIFLLGATGHTGREILGRAIARGHQVTAFVRSPRKLGPTPGLTIVEGSPLDRVLLARSLANHDAVLSALGVRPPAAFRPHTLVADCARTTIAAMEEAGVQRLAIVSAAVLFPEPGFAFAFFRWLLSHIADDLRAMEELVRASPLDWTIVRPPRLVASPDEQIRFAIDAMPPHPRPVSFGAVATFMLAAVETHELSRALVGATK